MLYLLLAIICSSAISLLMRATDKYVKNNMIMFAANYAVCGLLSLAFLLADGGSLKPENESVTAAAVSFAVVLGLISGVLYLVSFMLLQFNIQKNGVVLASTFMKLGVIVPVVMSVMLGWDKPSVMQIIGCLLAVVAIVIINGQSKGEKKGNVAAMWLLVLLFVGGFTDSMSNIYDKLGAGELKNQYLLFIFIAAMFVSIVFAFIKKQSFTVRDALCGLAIGVPNYFSARFLLYALGSLPVIVAYPVYNIAVILIISLIGFLFFKEKLGLRKLLGMAAIILAILLLNLKL